MDRITHVKKWRRDYEAAPVADTAAALIENANGDVDDAIETAEFMRKKTESQIEKARQDAEEAEDPETHQDIKNRIKEMEGNVKYWDDVVKFLEDVKKGAEVQAEGEAQAEAEENAPATEETPIEENAPAEGAEETKTEETKEDVPSSETEEANAPEASEKKGADEGKDADNKAVESENKDEEPPVIGYSTRWGKISQWTTGRFKEAVDFLTKAKSGILKGVFHRDDIGDISIGWGEAPNNYNGRGLAHIIRKHINVMHDFNSVDDMIRTIENVIENGKLNKNTDGNYELEDGSYRVVIVNDEDGNWILSAFDYIHSKKEKLRRKDTAAVETPSQSNVESGAVNSNLSTDKVTESSTPVQESEKESDAEKHSERSTEGQTAGETETEAKEKEGDEEVKESKRGDESEEEMRTIIEKAKKDGTYMLAPNGEKSNLNEGQWAQVRTKNFKDWFGDWENDPANASKVVDENGEPLVVYHYDREKFNDFSNKKKQSNTDRIYFSPFKDKWRGFSGNIESKVFLNIRVPKYGGIESNSIDAFEDNDGLILDNDGVVEEYIVNNPNQIKSATDNTGEFSKDNDDVRYSKRSEVPRENKSTMRDRVQKWLSNENLEWAKGKSREEIFEHFGNDMQPIAIVPVGYLKYLGENFKNNAAYCGMGYMIDHAVNHHSEESIENYSRIQEIIDHPDFVKLDNRRETDYLLCL